MAQMHNNLSPAEGIWSLRRLPDMDEAQFSQWQTLLEHRTGITLSAERRSFLETNLGIRMREIGCSSYQAYYEKIVSRFRKPGFSATPTPSGWFPTTS